MSAIFGFLRLDEQPASRQELAAMEEALAHRGREGGGLWLDGPVALGHRSLRFDDRAPGEGQPLVDQGRGFSLTADCILDNAAELLTVLGIDGKETSRVSDAALILAAHRAWAGEAPERLLGDFAYALWDGRQRTLTCVRDHLGIRPLCYFHLPGRLFAFASEIKGLLALPEVPRELDELAVGDFLVVNLSDKERTFYRGIRRLPRSESLTVGAGRFTRHRYWEPEDRPRLRLPSGEAYAEAMVEQLQQAVDCRLRCDHRLGSHLSGGLDSSGVAVLASRTLRERGERLVTASFVPRLEEGWPVRDERPYVAALREAEELESFDIESPPGGSVDLTSIDPDRPVLMEGVPETEAASLMSERGVRVVLSGWGGDEVSTFNGRGYYSELLLSGRWGTLLRESRARCRNYSIGWPRFFLGHVVSYLLPGWVHDLRAAMSPRRDRRRTMVLNPEFTRRLGLQERWRRMAVSLGPGLRRNQLALIRDGHIQHRTETWDLIGARHGVYYRFPLLDRRLIEFCLSLPPDQWARDGWTRYLYRAAMKGVLPEKIRWRPDKLAPLPDSSRQLVRSKGRLLERLEEVEARPDLARYFDLDKMRRQIEALPEEEAFRQRSVRQFEAGQQLHLTEAGGALRGLALARYLIAAGLV